MRETPDGKKTYWLEKTPLFLSRGIYIINQSRVGEDEDDNQSSGKKVLTDEKEQDEFFKRIREKNDIEPVIRSHPTFQKKCNKKT